jgi:phosphatidate cytidylyltransferase
MLRTRLLTAIVLLVGLVSIAAWAPDGIFDGLLLLIIAIAVFEWMRLLAVSAVSALIISAGFLVAGALALAASGVPSLIPPGLVITEFSNAAPLSASLWGVLVIYFLAALIWVVGVPLSFRRFKPLGGQALAGKLSALLLLTAAWLALLQADNLGKGFLLSVLLIVWVADTAAYFAGRAFGRRKLAPSISPGKSQEGVAGAVLANLALAAFFTLSPPAWFSQQGGNIFLLLEQAIGWWLMLLVVLLLTLVSVVGDLYESMIKRVAGAKDSGVILPGHGGVLDRIDALIAVFPVTMFVVLLIQLSQRL